jgi:hypothetical protein
MKLNEINDKSIRHVSIQELLSLHRRIHQLYSLWKKKNVDKEKISMIIKKHEIIERAIIRRKLNHKTPLKESLLNLFLEVN